jgi:O-antigen ligase
MRTFAFLLSLALVSAIPWENAVTAGELGTLTRVIGVLATIVWLWSVSVTKGFRKPHPFHMAMVLFIWWNIVSLLWSIGFDETVRHIKTYIQLGILAWILWDMYTTPKALRLALQAYVLGAYVTIGSTIYNYLTGEIISEYQLGRFAGSGLNAVDQAIILALGLPIAWHLGTSEGSGINNRVLRLVNFAYIPTSLFAIILTGSRMALFAVLPAIVYVIGTANRLKASIRISIFAVFVGALFAILPYIPASTLNRLGTASDSIATGDLGPRGKLWRESVAVFSEHPLLGVGSGALRTVKELGGVAHNTFLSVMAELGLIGFVLFAVMLAIVVHQSVNQTKGLSGLWLTVLAIWTIGVSSLTWEFRKPTWLFLSLIVISANQSYEYTDPERRHT